MSLLRTDGSAGARDGSPAASDVLAGATLPRPGQTARFARARRAESVAARTPRASPPTRRGAVSVAIRSGGRRRRARSHRGDDPLHQPRAALPAGPLTTPARV